jgi:trk system potassium uptake protein TrkH
VQQIKVFSKSSPSKALVLGFAVLILIGAGLLMLPASSVQGISFIDALFTSTSAVCVTGLIVKNTPDDFTFFGQMVLLCLIQIGGLGYMSMATLMALLLGRRIGISERLLLKESLNISTLEGLVAFMRKMLIFVFVVEAVGAVSLSVRLAFDMPWGEALFSGIFHAISAFNNAGFSLFSDSIIGYRGDVFINIVLMLLIVLGGLGFIVILDVFGARKAGAARLTQHSRVVLTTTLFLIIIPAVLIFFTERQYYFLSENIPTAERIFASLFASITARTAGFNSIDYALLQPVTLVLTMALMVIGGSPGSTAGGIKTTTFTVILMHLWCTVRGRTDTVIFHRRINESLIARAMVMLALALLYIVVVTFVVMDFEHSKLLPTIFEVISAFGTVGLSLGGGGSVSFSANFTVFSKIIFVFTMFLGRVGPLTLFLALLRRREQRFRYPEGRVMIG